MCFGPGRGHTHTALSTVTHTHTPRPVLCLPWDAGWREAESVGNCFSGPCLSWEETQAVLESAFSPLYPSKPVSFFSRNSKHFPSSEQNNKKGQSQCWDHFCCKHFFLVFRGIKKIGGIIEDQVHGSNIIKLIKAFMDSWQIDSLSVCGLMSSLLSTVLFKIFSFGV